VREFLIKENKSWSVPERRVRKFVKRQSQLPLTANSSTEDDDNRSKSSSVVKSRVKGMMKGAGRIFGSGHKKSAVDEVPVFEIRTSTSSVLSPFDRERAESIEDDPLTPPYTSNRQPAQTPGGKDMDSRFSERVDRELPADGVDREPPADGVDREPPADGVDRDLPADESLVYKDDNDGKKDRRCAPCEGCIVL
jgi:hypothetical protein